MVFTSWLSLTYSNNLRSPRGFSLLELMVVISIIGVLAAILIPRIGSYQTRELLKQSVNQFEVAIRTAQSNSMTGVRCGSNAEPVNKAKSWQVVMNSVAGYELKPDCQNGVAQPTFTYSLPTGVTFKGIYFEKTGSTCGTPIGTKITFENISGKVGFESIGSCNPDLYSRLVMVFGTSSGDDRSLSLEFGGTSYFSDTQASYPTLVP